MKFVCVQCDAAMVLRDAVGPHEGTMCIVYGCNECGHETAMLTNKMETQMVRSLGVKIGGRTREAAPMEMVTSTLETPRAPAAMSGCPFSGMVSDAFNFSGSSMEWTEGARARINNVPEFIRSMVEDNIEEHAEKMGLKVVDESVLDSMKEELGI